MEQYGTYEKNGIAFQDANEIWWLETIGGHHWIARRVPDDSYVVMPNQLGLDVFDLEDALFEQKEYMCSADMREFIEENHLDLSLMTADPRIGQDAAEFFKNMSIGNLQGSYQYLIVSPVSLKSRILQMMDEEIIKGSEGRIIMKMNSVTDVDFIKKVSEASCAGVRVDLIVRGICCILPGVPGFTENVRVMSVVGRYLEHPRIFSFGTGKEQKIYIGSADMMTRNTEKRVEVACPVLDGQIRRQINHDLKIMLNDNVKARIMQKDGTYMKRTGGIKAVDSQAAFMEEALKAAEEVDKSQQRARENCGGGRVITFFRSLWHRKR